MEEFTGRVAVVTGAASGIGKAMARRFGEAGMRLVLADIERTALDAAVEEFASAGIEAVGVAGDVSKRDDVQHIADVAMETFGAVHVVCNNAGVAGSGTTWEMSVADWEWVLGVDLWGVIHGVGVFTPLIIASGGGHIVNTASMAGVTSVPFMGAYNVAKHGVVTLSETMYHELALIHPEVGVSVVCPGWVQTQINRSERNKPEVPGVSAALSEDGGEAAAGSSPAMTDGFRDVIDGLIASGIKPEDVAQQVFEAVRDRTFWVFTHPSWLGQVLTGAERMVASENPVMVLPSSTDPSAIE